MLVLSFKVCMDILKLIFGEGSPDCAYRGRDLKCPKKRAECHAWESKIKQNPNVPEDIYRGNST